MDETNFGHTLRMLRTSSGMSLRKLAKSIRVSPAYLSQVESGKLPPPTHDRILQISGILGIREETLLTLSARHDKRVLNLLKKHPELNGLIQALCSVGLEPGDFRFLSELAMNLGREGIREMLDQTGNRMGQTRTRFLGKKNAGIKVGGVTGRYGIQDLLDERLVFPGVSGMGKNALLRFLINRASQVHGSFDPERMHGKLVALEEESSTGLGKGVAIPYIYIDGLQRSLMAVVSIPGGIDFDSIDGQPVYFVCLLLATGEMQPVLPGIVADLARRFQVQGFIENILKARTRDELIKILIEEGSRYGNLNH